jgi:hypothetical protein
MMMMANLEESTMTNYSQMSPPTSAGWTLLKMKMRSIEESGGSRMPNMPSIGGTQKPAHGTHLTAETSTVPSLQPTIANTTHQSVTSLKQLY